MLWQRDRLDLDPRAALRICFFPLFIAATFSRARRVRTERSSTAARPGPVQVFMVGTRDPWLHITVCSLLRRNHAQISILLRWPLAGATQLCKLCPNFSPHRRSLESTLFHPRTALHLARSLFTPWILLALGVPSFGTTPWILRRSMVCIVLCYW